MTWTTSLGYLAAFAGLLSAGHAAEALAQTDPGVRCQSDVAVAARRNSVEFAGQGQTIPGLVYEPAVPNGGAIVLLHGAGGLGGDAPLFDHHAIQLASRGYHVLVPHYFAARRSRVGRSDSDVAAWIGVGADAVRYVGGLPGADRERVALWGYSLGGFLATDGAMREDVPVRVAIGVSTGTDVWSPSRSRRALPVLLIHGRRDPAVSYDSMLGLAANLRRRGATVDTALIASNQHPIAVDGWCEVFDHTRAFLDAHLTTPPAETGRTD